MAKIYFDLIKKNLKTIDNVPLRWKDQVQELLNTDAE
ncbi:CD1375 family protein [Paenibacillus macerans]|nr:CD1375 family protein [Paenibacillus macerans]